MPGGMAQQREKVVGGEIRRDGASIWWKGGVWAGKKVRRLSTGGGRDGMADLGKKGSSRRQGWPITFLA
jgi:hypothetical protein